MHSRQSTHSSIEEADKCIEYFVKFSSFLRLIKNSFELLRECQEKVFPVENRLVN